MKQFFAQITSPTLPAPAQVLAAMERGAAYIHDLPYRFAAWLPSAPGLLLRLGRRALQWLHDTETAQEVRAIGRWMERKAAAIHEVPYRLAAWLPTVPGKIAARRQRRREKLHRWAVRNDVGQRAALLLTLSFVALLLPFCLQPIEQNEAIYLLTEGGEPEFIHGTPKSDRRLPGLSILTDDSARDAQLVLDAGQFIRVQSGNRVYCTTTRKETVANLLRRLGVEYGGEKMVALDISGDTPVIRVQEEYTCDWYATLETDYTTKRVPNYLKKYKTESVLQEGQKGSILTTYRDVYRKGQLDTTLLVSQEITDPVQEVIEYGTLVKEVSRSDRIKKVVYNDDGSGYLLFKSGKTMTFSEKVTCNATAYSIGNWTASGRPTKVGNIAVDPKVFPYGTRFYIFTNDGYLVYGNAVAADCGSAIKGYKIDLWFETFDEACWFGRRDCTVFVLN